VSITFTVPGTPVPKGRPRMGRNGNVYTPRRTAEYEADIGNEWIALSPRPQPLWGDVRVDVTVHEGPRVADADNYLKAVLDALNTLAWLDDKQVVEATVRVCRSAPEPRLEVTVEAIDAS